MKFSNFIKIGFLSIVFVSLLNACKKNYEAPPVTGDPNITVTHTIKQLKAMHTVPGVIDDINTDIVIAGVVIANDKSGNLYKQIYIQDATGALNVMLADNGLYTNFPIGKKVFIKCKGLSLSDYHGLMQLGIKATSSGNPSVDAIPSPLIYTYVVGGSLNNSYTIKNITIDQINTDMQNPLVGDIIQLSGYEFMWGDIAKTFADTSSAKNAGELYIQGCATGSQSIMVRTSGYSDFAAKHPPSGNGNIIAILTVYSTTPQLVLRNIDDIKFTNARCNAPTTTSVNTTIKDLKALHTIPSNYDVINTELVIEGTVIGNDISGNIYKQIFIRDSTGALQINIDNTSLAASYPVGRKIKVLCKGLCISDVNYMTQLGVKGSVNGIVGLYPISSAQQSSYILASSYDNNPVLPKQVSLSDLNNASTAIATMQNPYLGDLIQLNGYEFIKGDLTKSYGDSSAWKKTVNTTISSCSGSQVIIRTSAYSNFAQNKVAQGNGTVNAIFTVYGTSPANVTKQLILRDVSDVQFNGPRCNLFEEDFQTGFYKDLNNCADQNGWKSYKESGDICFMFNQLASGATFPQVTAFSSGMLPTTNIKAWLVSPAITLPAGTSPKYFYDVTERYTAGYLKVLVSSTYDGVSATPWTANWTEINSILSTSSAFTNKSYTADLSGFAGNKIYLAFKYDVAAGTSKNAAATYQPDNIKVTKN